MPNRCYDENSLREAELVLEAREIARPLAIGAERGRLFGVSKTAFSTPERRWDMRKHVERNSDPSKPRCRSNGTGILVSDSRWGAS